jgi:hypothetical protein
MLPGRDTPCTSSAEVKDGLELQPRPISVCSQGHGPIIALEGHSHAPGCGHEMIAHEGHLDYIGDDGMLHHVLLAHPDCCDTHAGAAGNSAGGGLIVSHGVVSKILNK